MKKQFKTEIDYTGTIRKLCWTDKAILNLNLLCMPDILSFEVTSPIIANKIIKNLKKQNINCHKSLTDKKTIIIKDEKLKTIFNSEFTKYIKYENSK